MVSTRHHPRAFPPPSLPTSPALASVSRRSPQTPTSTTPSSKPTSASPPPPSTRRATSRKRKSIIPKTEEEEIKEITDQATKKAEEMSPAQATSTTSRSSTRAKSPRATGRTARPSKSRAQGSYEHTPPPILIPWLFLSLPLVLWDTSYMLGRPHTMPGGRVHHYLWKPYALYGTMDYVYGLAAYEARDGFGPAQATMNIVETAIYIYYLYVVSKRVATGDGFINGIALKAANVFSRRDSGDRSKIVILGGSDVALAVLLCFAAFVMTLAKTILYGLNEVYSGSGYVGHNGLPLLALWTFANSGWIIVPAWMSVVLGKEIVEGLTTGKGGRAKRSADHEE